MKKNISNMTALEWVIVSLAAISVVLLIVGLFCPPPGQIHNSVILGVCALFAYATLLTVLYAIKRGADAKLSKGDLSLEINNPDKDDDND